MKETETPPKSAEDREGLPPFAKTWGQLYWLLVAELVLLMVLFYLFSIAFV